MRVWLYYRLSRDEDDELNSLKNQRSIIESYALSNGHIEALANMLGYSEYYLSKKFKKEIGRSIKEFIRTQRLERAKVLLMNDQYTVLEVSDRLKFCAPSYFSDAFRKEYGISPTEY